MDKMKVYEGKLNNDIHYEIYISEGFSGNSEIALKVENKVVSVTTIEIRKRTGNIICRPANIKNVLIKREFKKENVIIPSLDDVLEEPQEKDPGAKSI